MKTRELLISWGELRVKMETLVGLVSQGHLEAAASILGILEIQQHIEAFHDKLDVATTASEEKKAVTKTK